MEWDVDGPLVTLLLSRSLRCIRIAQQLYWCVNIFITHTVHQLRSVTLTVLNGSGTPVAFHRLLVDALEDWLYKSWVSKVLSALKHCCGRALRLELQRENRLMDLLTQVAQRVRTADKTKRKVRFNSLIHFSFRFVSEMKPL